MEDNKWVRAVERGRVYLEHDGYVIPGDDLIQDPTFWMRQIGEKTWGTRDVLLDLAARWIDEAGFDARD